MERCEVVESLDPEVDKSDWRTGPWHEEPDRVEWRYGLFSCLITRNPRQGHLCGYVALALGHPWHGKDPGRFEAIAHGGVNYAAPCNRRVCHVPKGGESDDVWWIGFDCGHGGYDRMPGMDAMLSKTSRFLEAAGAPAELWHKDFDPYADAWPGCSYKTVAYVMASVERLALQAHYASLVRVPK